MAEATTKTVAEDVPPNVMKLVDEFVRRYGKRKVSVLLDEMEAIHELMEEAER